MEGVWEPGADAVFPSAARDAEDIPLLDATDPTEPEEDIASWQRELEKAEQARKRKRADLLAQSAGWAARLAGSAEFRGGRSRASRKVLAGELIPELGALLSAQFASPAGYNSDEYRVAKGVLDRAEALRASKV